MRLWDILSFICFSPLSKVLAYWDFGTSTINTFERTDLTARQSRFRWQKSESDFWRIFFPWWNWYELEFRRRLYTVVGISYDMINVSTGVILNRRTIITAANCLDPYMTRANNLRIWALGRYGDHITPYRYRVWRVSRVYPRSLNPEHQHGPFGYHSPRHDIAIVHTFDQMYLYTHAYWNGAYPYRAFVPTTNQYIFTHQVMYFVGSGYEYLEHIYENYKIFYTRIHKSLIRDCSILLPKWWGKFVCVVNIDNLPGVQNGGGLFDYRIVVGFGCFEIRYNEDRQFVFTDMRYYLIPIYDLAHTTPGEYYEYAYPQWSTITFFFGLFDIPGNNPRIPLLQIKNDMYPLGK